MTMSTHVAVGATIGLAVQHPVLGFTLGFVSHFLLDTIPHGDSKISQKHYSKSRSIAPYAYVALDNALAIYLLLIFINAAPQTMLHAISFGVAGSILPDVFVGVYEASRRKWLKTFFAWHLKIHNSITSRTGDIPLFAGLGYQAAFIAFLFILRG